MTAEHVFYGIIALLVFDYIVDKYLDLLNANRRKSLLPDLFKGIYKQEAYRRAQDYGRVNTRFSFISSTISFVILLAFLILGGFGLVDSLALQLTEHPIGRALIFFAVIALASQILALPFALYRTFVIEERFGFNKTTLKTFFLDSLKGLLLGAIIGGGLMALIIWFYLQTTDWFWLWAWLLVSLFSVFMAMFYSSLIVPLFNKQTPLPEGELRTAIEDFCQKVGFQLQNVFVIDGSKRSTKANAYFTGLGHKKRIVLYDTLINDLSTDELVAVLAHEIGHYQKKHIIVSLLLGVIQTGLMFFLLSLFVSLPEMTQALAPKASQAVFHIGLIAFGLLYSPVSLLLGLLMNVISRKNEYQADKFAGQNHRPQYLANALVRLSMKNLSNLTPHPAYVFVHYSHPPIIKRLEALNVKLKPEDFKQTVNTEEQHDKQTTD